MLHVLAIVFLTIPSSTGVPRIVRADNGTENVTIAGLQRFFRADHMDAFARDKSFMYGRSVTNQV